MVVHFIRETINKIQTFLASNSLSLTTRSDVLLVRDDADCGYTFRNKAYSPISDSIFEFFDKAGFSTQIIVKPYSSYFGEKSYYNSLVFNRLFFKNLVISKFFWRTQSKKRLDWLEVEDEKVWSVLLKKINPQLVLAIEPSTSLCRAARKLFIKVYDIQHGIIGPSNPRYGHELPSLTSKDSLPTGFLCWDQPSADYIKSWASRFGCDVEVIGNLWIERFREPSLDDVVVNDEIKNNDFSNFDKPIILVSLQWGMQTYYPSWKGDKFLCDELTKVIINTSDDFIWFLRKHPVQMTGREKDLCDAFLKLNFGGLRNVYWDLPSCAPLPVLLPNVNLHISDLSTVAVECSWFGIPSALLNPLLEPGNKYEAMFEDLRESGHVSLVKQDYKTIQHWIKSNINNSKLKTTCGKSTQMFKSFVSGNILRDD